MTASQRERPAPTTIRTYPGPASRCRAWYWRIRLAACEVFFCLGLRFAGSLARLVRFAGRLGRLLACAIHGFLRFLAYGLSSLFCFPANRFGSLLCFLACCFQSVFDCFSCFLRAVLYVVNNAVLAERSQRGHRNESSD